MVKYVQGRINILLTLKDHQLANREVIFNLNFQKNIQKVTDYNRKNPHKRHDLGFIHFLPYLINNLAYPDDC